MHFSSAIAIWPAIRMDRFDLRMFAERTEVPAVAGIIGALEMDRQRMISPSGPECAINLFAPCMLRPVIAPTA